MGKLTKALGIAGLLVAVKGSYYLGKTAGEDVRYDLNRREGTAYLVDKVNREEAKLDETKPLRSQAAFCVPAQASSSGKKKTLDGYVNMAMNYLRHVLE